MEARTLLQKQLAGSPQVIRYSLGEILDQDARHAQHDALAEHLAGRPSRARKRQLPQAGGRNGVGADYYTELFKGGSGGEAAYPPLEQVVRVFDDTHGALVTAAADLDAANEGPRGLWKNLGGMFTFVNVHRWYHTGKITSLRALLGSPRLFG